MGIGTSIIIFFLAIVTLLSEFILYMITGMGASLAGNFSSLSHSAIFFVCLMIFTAFTGILAPICAIIELIMKKRKIGLKLMLILLGLILLGLTFFYIYISSVATESFNNYSNTSKAEKRTEESVKSQYIPQINLYDFNAKYYETYLDGKIPGVTFKLKNESDKILKEVEVTVYFKDLSNNVIAEENYYPVLFNTSSFNDGKPLKQNYVWQMEQGKFYSAKSVPSEWQEGNAIAEITNIEFLEK